MLLCSRPQSKLELTLRHIHLLLAFVVVDHNLGFQFFSFWSRKKNNYVVCTCTVSISNQSLPIIQVLQIAGSEDASSVMQIDQGNVLLLAHIDMY